MNIHLIRHGKTVANVQKLYCGATDLPLSETGSCEIADLRDQNIYPVLGDGCLYFTSGMLRTDQTLGLIFGQAPRKALPKMAEISFGEFEMKSYELLKSQDDYQEWIMDKTGDVACPGGESKNIFLRRVLDEYAMLENYAKQGNDVLLVCHGGVIASIMEHLFPNTLHFYEWQPAPGRGYTVVYGDNLIHTKI